MAQRDACFCPGPLLFSLATQRVKSVDVECTDRCRYALGVSDGDSRVEPTGPHAAAADQRATDPHRLALLRKALHGFEGAASGISAVLVRAFNRARDSLGTNN